MEIPNVSQMIDQLGQGAELKEDQVQYLAGPMIAPPTPGVPPARQTFRTKSPRGEKSKEAREKGQRQKERRRRRKREKKKEK